LSLNDLDGRRTASLAGASPRLPAAVLVPMGLGWLRIEGEQLGFYDSPMGVDLMTVAMIWLFFLLIWWNARLLDAASRETRRVQDELRAQSEEVRDLYENAPCGYHSLDKHGLVLRMNATELGWLGYGRDEVVGRRHFFELMTPAGREVFEREFPRFVAIGEIRDVELEMQRKDGSAMFVSINASAIKDAAGRFVMSRSTVFDITARKRAENALRDSEAAIRELALTDPLTGVANRRRLDEALRSEIARAGRYGNRISVVMADLDWFKRVNDEFGHAVGDAVLQRFAALIREHCRDSDLVARYGGEEFVVLMPEAGAKAAAAWAERVRAIQEKALEPPQRSPTTATFGVAEYSAGETAEALLRRADEALYAGKAAGRNRVQVA
jgi:diguanylate cyclase (GGDEF)-like protein/PAS domain S-box-containing protein